MSSRIRRRGALLRRRSTTKMCDVSVARLIDKEGKDQQIALKLLLFITDNHILLFRFNRLLTEKQRIVKMLKFLTSSIVECHIDQDARFDESKILRSRQKMDGCEAEEYDFDSRI
ncbi:hypothetical protein CAEBREN_01044 [Caenorhabditis brenneri]|uniref:Uncharacterized protein n=1 Tax=Caenorhabditis brenneri TaxID=135651 RepID=G0NPV2_CAEBE|nr:hypothetical protein CAEBREN_01044 [Caenorhabditis brenneri]